MFSLSFWKNNLFKPSLALEILLALFSSLVFTACPTPVPATSSPTYTITYNANGATSGTVPTDTNHYVSGATAKVAGNTGSLAFSGKTFAGWNTQANGSGSTYLAGASLTVNSANVTLYAVWTAIPTYTITYFANGATSGTVPLDSNSYSSGTLATIAGNTGSLTLSGYTFTGWNTQANGAGTAYHAGNSLTIGSTDVTLYAVWTALPTYSITYSANGATSGTVPLDSNHYLSGAMATVAGNTGSLALSGYTFVGWNTQANGSGTSYSVGGSLVVGSSNITLYAKWTAQPTYTVTYNSNGATGGTPPNDSNQYLSGSVVSISGNSGSLALSGQTFAGWNTQANGTGTTYQPGSSLTISSANVTLYALWTVLPTYTITYNANGATSGTIPTDSNQYLSGSNATIVGNINSLTLPGYSFTGWNTQANGSGTSYSAGSSLTIGASNVTLYAVWTPLPTYTITYNANGATGGTVPTDSNKYLAGSPVAVAGNTGSLSLTGSTFAGWNTQANGLGTTYSAGSSFTMGSANVNLYAVWTSLPTYTITYNANGASSGTVPIDSNQYLSGSTATVAGNSGSLALSGSTFVGWNTQANGLGTSYSAGTALTIGSVNLTLYAIWTALPTYTVTYNTNGATSGTAPTDTNKYLSGAVATISGNTGSLSQTGYAFAGWNTQANGSGTTYSPGSSLTLGLSNVTLYAFWSPVFTLSYSANGATSGTTPTDTNKYLSGAVATISGNTGSLTLTGYNFAGWNTQANGLGTSYVAGSSLTFGSSNVTLYAVWTALSTFTLTYNANGATSGTVPTDSNKYLSGTVATLAGNTGSLALSGYTFAGWNTQANGSGTSYTAGSSLTMGSANVTLYAVWTALPTYTITYNANGATSGTVPTDSNLYLSGALATLAGNAGSLTLSGYTFNGWNTQANGSGNSYAAGSSLTMGSANVTLYAVWTPLPTFTITYNSNGATSGTIPSDSNHYLSGTVATILGNSASLALSGYSFDGWNTQANGSGTSYAAGSSLTMGSANVILYAVWTALPTYTMTYNANGATSGSVPTDTNHYLSGAVATVASNTGSLALSGYTFAGWNTQANGSGTSYSGGSSLTMGSANVTLYAVWTALPTYTMTYNANGATSGTVPTDSNKYLSGAVATVANNTGSLALSGYSFAGWNTQANGSGTSYAAGSSLTMGSANVILYAVWTNSNSGTITLSNPINYTVTISGTTTVYVGISAEFTSTYNGTPKSYQWYLNGTPLQGATSSTLTYVQSAATAYYGVNQLMLAITDANGLIYTASYPITISY